jgi:hypothetical protein
LRTTLKERGALAVIPAKADRKTPTPHDAEMWMPPQMRRRLP